MIVIGREDSETSKFDTITQDSLSMREIIEFFKDEEILKELENNKNLTTIAVQQELISSDIKITLALFDNAKLNVYSKKAIVVKNLDSELEQSFGGKNIIALQ